MKWFYACFLIIIFSLGSSAQPKPGDVFRDYIWTTPEESGYDFLRIIGDGDYREPVNLEKAYPQQCVQDGWVIFNHDVDLEKAVKVELQVEFLLSHDETTGFAVKINDNPWHYFSMPEAVPEPKATYLQHNYPVIPIPLEEIHRGTGNRIRFRVDSIQRFGMPQNILYGFKLRIYYDRSKDHASGIIAGLENGKTFGENQLLELKKTKGSIKNVHYVALCRDVNFAGDGIYRQWQYTFYRGEYRNHIGTSGSSPFRINWNTGWLPDQNMPVEISAFVTNDKNITHFLPPVKDLTLERDYSVELCTPFELPQRWATREKEFEQKIMVTGNPQKAEVFQLAFTSWSPGYLNGIYVNDWLVPTFEACNYCYGVHRLTIDKPHFLKQGVNKIKTGLTPLVFGKMVHGTEVLFPGMMLLVKYPTKPVAVSEVKWKETDHFKVETQNATWYIEKMSGGCSSLIDESGRDWIFFKKTGDNPPLMSADSDFRGLPNLVFREPGDGIGHPGFDKCTVTQSAPNELLVKSNDNKWQFRWLFFANHAEIKIEKTDESRKYWFLYEGPAGGNFSPGSHYWGNSADGLRTDNPSIYKDSQSGTWQWAFFGDRSVYNSFFVAQKETDSLPDFFAYMGNDPQKQNLSKDGMNVFGFGRSLKTQPLLSGENLFLIGLFPLPLNTKENLNAFEKYIEELIK